MSLEKQYQHCRDVEEASSGHQGTSPVEAFKDVEMHTCIIRTGNQEAKLILPARGHDQQERSHSIRYYKSIPLFQDRRHSEDSTTSLCCQL